MATDYVRDHISRCIESYSFDLDFSETPSREAYEQLRADLMIAVGIMSALHFMIEKEDT